jgi:hypothetical protein
MVGLDPAICNSCSHRGATQLPSTHDSHESLGPGDPSTSRPPGHRSPRHGAAADLHLRHDPTLGEQSALARDLAAAVRLVTFSHIVHGFLFYGAIRLIFRHRITVWPALLIAMGVEIGWEILENTSWVIEAYRQQALAQGYVGDSTINSVFDTFSMMAGFAIARRIPVWASVCLVLILELAAAYVIHDNLTLNVLNFIHPIDAITRWQSEIH